MIEQNYLWSTFFDKPDKFFINLSIYFIRSSIGSSISSWIQTSEFSLNFSEIVCKKWKQVCKKMEMDTENIIWGIHPYALNFSKQTFIGRANFNGIKTEWRQILLCALSWKIRKSCNVNDLLCVTKNFPFLFLNHNHIESWQENGIR